LAGKLEADLRQYYQVPLRAIYGKDPNFTLREIMVLIEFLPQEARFVKHLNDDGFSATEHLLANVYDVSMQILYQSSLTASGTLQKDYAKSRKHAPKPMERPTVKPKPKRVYKFLTGAELKARMEAKRRLTIYHTKGCQDSREYVENGSCSCPRE